MLEQQVMHRPELPLSAGALGRFGGLQRVRMHFLERAVTEREPHLLGKTLQQQLDRRCRLLAVRTFKVGVFHHRHRGVLGSQDVIHGAHRRAQLEEMTRAHCRSGALI
jgi:hypothetical protein